MKRSDCLLVLLLCAVVCLFGFIAPLRDEYMQANAAHPYWMAFLKFAILATLGEMIGLRIKTGSYNEPGFGILPRAVVWGLLGMWIAVALKTFAAGIPHFLQSLGVDQAVEAMKGSLSVEKVLCAFVISVMMNTTFGPVFMTVHKVTDTYLKLWRVAESFDYADTFRRNFVGPELESTVGVCFQKNDTLVLDTGAYNHFFIEATTSGPFCYIVGCRFGYFPFNSGDR